jgi:GDP-mannose transporter
MNFLLLCIQSLVCVACVATVKKAGIISFRTFDVHDAKAWFPISFLLVSVIYTGSKSLVSFSSNRSTAKAECHIWFQQYLSIPVYTIFKNLTIILIVCYFSLFYFYYVKVFFRHMEKSFGLAEELRA